MISDYTYLDLDCKEQGSVSYKSSSFGCALQRIDKFRRSENFIDVVLVSGKFRIKAHRLILSAASDYFAAMFTNTMMESNQYEITLREVDSHALKSIIRFIYTGRVDVNEHRVRALFETSRLLLISEVESFCVDFLKNSLSPATCFRLRDFADSYSCSTLLKAARHYIAENFSHLIKEEDFLNLPAEEVASLLSNHNLNIPSEEAAFEALNLWLDYNPVERSIYAGKFLSHIRVPLFSRQFITDNIENEPMYFEDAQARKIITEAYEYQLIPEMRNVMKSERTKGRPSVVGDMCAIGRMDNADPTIKVERYDSYNELWHKVTTLTTERLQFGLCNWQNNMCLVGGHHGPTILNTVELFNARTLERSTLPSMITSRYGMGAGILDNKIFVAGGHDGRSYINSVEFYNQDPSGGQWATCGAMLSNKFRAGVTVLDNKLYAIGGINDAGRSATVEIYDAYQDRWLNVSPLSRARNAVGVAALNGVIYAVGGVDRTVLESMERYDPREGTWTLLASMKIARARLGVSALGPWLYAAGGYNGNGEFLRHTELYYPEMNRWQTVSRLNEICAANMITIPFERHTVKR